MIQTKHRITLTATLTLDEAEVRALDALAGYGDKAFLEAFYRECGRHYLEPNERGIRSLFEKVRKECKPAIDDVDAARKLLDESKQARKQPALAV